MLVALGNGWERDLWKSRYRLRFELNNGAVPLSMFTSSYDRARRLARAALPSESVVAIVAAHPHLARASGAGWKGCGKRSAFDLLAEMGVSTETWEAWRDYVRSGDVEDVKAEPWVQRACRVTWEQADILLWNQIAHDLGVTPQAPVTSKLVDELRGVSVFAYDDRGMDVTALSAGAISSLREQFNEWLLDHDRPRMADAFATGESR